MLVDIHGMSGESWPINEDSDSVVDGVQKDCYSGAVMLSLPR
jgi:hypothetical protein